MARPEALGPGRDRQQLAADRHLPDEPDPPAARGGQGQDRAHADAGHVEADGAGGERVAELVHGGAGEQDQQLEGEQPLDRDERRMGGAHRPRL
ncbi:MAG: hypothetical protein E6J41_33915 [Chloroflexi bacterium]|nr:MAG: hypothetical protein E6J41_33915 [Chloroflexota bacterium]